MYESVYQATSLNIITSQIPHLRVPSKKSMSSKDKFGGDTNIQTITDAFLCMFIDFQVDYLKD